MVISIIGLLTSLALVSLADARSKTRDAIRLSDIRTIQTAMQMYYEDNNRYMNNRCWRYSHVESGWNELYGYLEDYMAELPQDPVNDSTYRYTFCTSTGWLGTQGYFLSFRPENPENYAELEARDGVIRCPHIDGFGKQCVYTWDSSHSLELGVSCPEGVAFKKKYADQLTGGSTLCLP